ncbi:MAG TPA: hypothetical protein PKM43_14580 [Verrucomicrobiota bacterium]|nr:hypothetical protein [Verrucomicrobiota bacterium]
MNNQPASASVAGIMGGVAAAFACLAIVLALQNRSLQNQISDTRRLWSEAVASTADLRVQHAASTADLSSHRQRLADLQQEIAALESRVSSNVAVSSQPVPVRIFNGTRLVGWGWIPASSTNRAGMAGEGVATVFLDTRNTSAPPADNPPPGDPQPAAPRIAMATSSSFTYQQYPYFWPAIWLGPDPDRDHDRGHHNPPQPPAPPTPEIQPRPTPTPTPAPAQRQVLRTVPQRLPTFSQPAARPAPFPQRPQVPAPIEPFAAPSPSTGMRGSSAAITRTANIGAARQPIDRKTATR